MRRVDDEYVGPFDELFQNLESSRLRWYLVRMSPQLAARRLHLDHAGTEVGQDHRGAGRRDEAREIDYLQSQENVVVRHLLLLSVEVRARENRGHGRRPFFNQLGDPAE
jgi:hypothetical protein